MFFEVWHDGDLFGEYTTNASGEIFLYDLEPGTYLVKEIASDDAHVVNSTPQQIELKAGDTQTRELVFFNSLKPGICYPPQGAGCHSYSNHLAGRHFPGGQ